LDRPVAELFATTCEHNVKTHECDECRYEVGVVKTDASLFDGGLLKKAKAEKRAVAAPLKLTGEVRFDDRRVAHVSTQAEGIIKAVHVTLGNKVKGGQALVEIESVAIGEAQAAYLEAAGMLTLAKRNHARLDTLRKEGISSEKELLSARQDLDAAQIRTDAAFGKLKRLGMSTSTARGLTQDTADGRLVLRTPIDGTVLDIHAVAGEVARADTSLATVGDNSSVWVWADLYERDIALVTREQAKQPLAASVEVMAFPGEEFAGTVDFVSPSMSESSRTVKARINVPNLEGRLLAGMFAEVKIFIPGDQRVLAVPSKAVLEDEGRSFVFVHYEGDYWVRRPVSPGRTFAGMTEISRGLTGSEVVVADGAFLLKSDVLRSKMGAGCAD
jgi:cobalt-zinc-cadmium efflux system membrane fusion protein